MWLCLSFFKKTTKRNEHKENWIYALIVTLIIIIAIVSMIFFVQQNIGDGWEKCQIMIKIIKYISQLLTMTRTTYNDKDLSWVKHLLKG